MNENAGSAQPANGTISPRRRPLLRGFGVCLLAGLLVYTLAGFLLLPWLARQQLVGFIGERLARHATLDRVRFNPYTFTLALEGLTVTEADGTALLAFDELFVDFEPASVAERAWAFSEVRLVHPRINFVRFAGGDHNLGRALEPLTQTPAPPPKATDDGDPLPLFFRKIVLDDGEVDVTDEALRTRFETHIGPISFEVRGLGTLPDRRAEQHFELVTESGARLDWSGTMQLNPIQSAGHIKASGERLRLLWRYVQDQVGFEIAEGTTALDLDYELDMVDSQPGLKVTDLALGLENLVVRPKGEKAELLRLPSLTATGGRLDLLGHTAHLGELRVKGLRLAALRDESGVLNVVRALQPAGGAKAPAPPAAGDAPPEEDQPAVNAEEVPGETASGDAEARAETREPGATDQPSEDAADAPADVEDPGETGDALVEAEPTPSPVAAEGEGVSDGGDSEEAEKAAPATEQPAAADAWSFTLGRVLIEDLAADFEDRGAAPLSTGVEELRLEARNLSSAPGAQFAVDLSTAIKTGGHIACAGNVGIDPPGADLQVKVEGLSLLLTQPFIDPVARLRLESVDLSIEGQARSSTDETFAFDGRIALSDLATKDTVLEDRFVAWKQLTLSDVKLRLDGRSLEIPQVDFESPYAKVVIAKDRSTNVGDIFAVGDSGATPEPDAEPEASQPFSVAVGKVVVRDGSATFADLSLPLPFETGIHALGGEISAIRTGSTRPTKVDLKGTVAKYGESRIKGKLNVFQPDQDTDIEVLFRNLDMTSFTPYSAKFAGYKIDEGKLTLELRYRIKDGDLRADNRIVLDQLTLGEEVESPDAVDLPLRLAVALLKDSDGRIDLQVPVNGRLDDPEFAYGPALRGTLKTLLVRAIKSPFSMLGSLVGADDENLDRVTFDAGSAELTPTATERLDKLAEALAKRPQLTVDVGGRYAVKTDGQALARAKVETRVDERLAKDGDEGDDARGEVTERFFRDEFSRTELDNLKAANTRIIEATLATGGPEPRLDQEAYLDALVAQLATRESVGNVELVALADARARAIADYLETQGVNVESVQVQGSERTTKIVDGRIRVKLKLGEH